MPETGAELTAAINEVVRMEVRGQQPLRSAYLRAFEAMEEAHPEVPKSEICSRTYAEINRRYWEEFGRPNGYPPEDCRVSRAWVWRVGSAHGYTASRYGQWDSDDKESTSRQPDTSDPPPGPGRSADVAEAIEALRGSLREARRRFQEHDAREALGDGEVDALVAEVNAVAHGIRELVGDRSTVPTLLQPLAALTLAGAASLEALVRRFEAATASEDLDGPRLTVRAVKNILQSRNAGCAPPMEPRSLVTACHRGFHGAACEAEGCGARRCLPDGGPGSPRIRCLSCGAVSPAPEWVTCHACLQPVPPGHAEGDCPHCDTPLRLPAGVARRPLLAP